jgi:P27 family predicted phage terminase small subunit
MGGPGSGRRPKPTAMKMLEGNAGHRKLNRREPKPAAGEPQSPIRLSPRARAHWVRLAPMLLNLKVLTIVDGDALAAYCTVLERWELATEAIAHGIIVTDDRGNGRPNPAVRIQSDALRHMATFESVFGLTPSARSKLGVSVDDGSEKKFDDFFNGAKTDEIVH